MNEYHTIIVMYCHEWRQCICDQCLYVQRKGVIALNEIIKGHLKLYYFILCRHAVGMMDKCCPVSDVSVGVTVPGSL